MGEKVDLGADCKSGRWSDRLKPNKLESIPDLNLCGRQFNKYKKRREVEQMLTIDYKALKKSPM